jgi:hypothetical protein
MPSPRCSPAIAAVVVLVLLAAAQARAAVPPAPSTRAVGMAGSSRGAATGDTALSLNPSGMSLVRSYVVEAAYLHDRVGDGKGHDFHLSIVDSTSGFNVAGGLYYTYLTDSPQDASSRSAHEGGAALSFPIGGYLFLGATAKYLRLRNDDPVPGTPGLISGFGFDVGLTIKPIPLLGIGLVATNVADASLGDRAPRTLGVGAGAGVTAELLLVFDAVYDITHGASRVWSFAGGAEYLFAKSFGVRAGFGRRGDTRANVVAVGVSLISEVAALDVGVQQDLGGARKELLVGVSGRVFVPSP